MVAATALAGLIRLPVILAATEPGIVPDEPGYWAIAHWASGSRHLTSMNDLPIYQPVHGMLLAPLEWLPVSPTARYKAALVLTFASVTAAAALVRHTMKKLGAGDGASAAGFVLVVLYPALTTTTSFTWSESTVVFFTVAFVAGLAHLSVDRGDCSRFVLCAVSVVAGLAPFVHGRLSALPLIWITALVWVSWSDPVSSLSRLGRGRALGFAALTVLCAISMSLVRSEMVDSLYHDPRSPGEAVTAVLGHPTRWGDLFWAASGQIWYAIVSSGGLALLGVVALCRSSSGPDRTRLTFAIGTLSTIGSVLAISASFMADILDRAGQDPTAAELVRTRWDHLTYGRYIDPVVLIAAVVGLYVLVELTRSEASRSEASRSGNSTRGRDAAPSPLRSARLQLAFAAGVSIALAVALWVAWNRSGLDSAVEPNLAGIGFVGTASGGARMLLATVVSVCVMGALAVASADRASLFRWGAAVLIVGAVLAGGTALDFHGRFSFAGLYEDVPPAGEGRYRALVASDAEEAPAAKLNWPGQQMMLSGRGWRFDFTELDSEAVTENPPSDVGLMAVLDDHAPNSASGQWQQVGEAGSVTIWFRRT